MRQCTRAISATGDEEIVVLGSGTPVAIVNIVGAVPGCGMTVHKEVIVTATSPESWEGAALNAVSRTDATVENIQWAVVQDQSIQLESPEEPQFKTKVKIGFEVET